jgi:magnesium transporter
VQAIVYVDNEPPEELSVDEAIGRIDGKHRLVWIDGDQPSAEEIASVAEKLGINEFTVEDLQSAGQRTKLDHYSDHFHVAVHDCEVRDPDRNLITREIDVVFGEGWLLSVRQEPETEDGSGKDLPTFPMDLVRRRFEQQRVEHGSTDEGFLLWAMLDVVVDRYFQVTDAVDGALDDAEEEVLGTDALEVAQRRGRPRQLFRLSKLLVRFRRAAAPLREVVGELIRRDAPCIGDAALNHLRDVQDHVLRIADLVESQRDVLTGLRDAELAVVSNAMSRSQQQIAAWGAMLIVATLVTGLLGMNFRNAPELDWEVGFLVIAGVITAMCIPMYIWFRRKDWL